MAQIIINLPQNGIAPQEFLPCYYSKNELGM
jgi:hypothetical protein